MTLSSTHSYSLTLLHDAGSPMLHVEHLTTSCKKFSLNSLCSPAKSMKTKLLLHLVDIITIVLFNISYRYQVYVHCVGYYSFWLNLLYVAFYRVYVYDKIRSDSWIVSDWKLKVEFVSCAVIIVIASRVYEILMICICPRIYYYVMFTLTLEMCIAHINSSIIRTMVKLNTKLLVLYIVWVPSSWCELYLKKLIMIWGWVAIWNGHAKENLLNCVSFLLAFTFVVD